MLATAVADFGVAINDSWFWSWLSTRVHFYVERSSFRKISLLTGNSSVKPKIDNCQWLVLAVNSHEVQKAQRWLQWCLGNKWDFFAASELLTSHVFVNWKVNFCHVFYCSFIAGNIFISSSGRESILNWATCIFAPHLFEVDSTHWNISSKHAVNLLEISLHYLNLIINAAQRLRWVDHWTNFSEVVQGACIEKLWFPVDNFWIVDLCSITWVLRIFSYAILSEAACLLSNCKS